MQLKLFTLPIKNSVEAEAEMNGFLRGHRILAVKKTLNRQKRVALVS